MEKNSPHRDDLLLIIGQTLSQVSDRMVQLGLIWFITSSFGENFLIWYLVVGGLPHAVLVKHSSMVIEHFTALRTVLYSDLARGLVYLVAFSLIVIYPEWLIIGAGSKILWILFLSVLISNIFSAFFNPAIMSLSVEIKEKDQIQKLTAKLSSITSFATIIGPIFGLFIFSKFGLSGLFIIAACSYLLSAYSVSLLSKSRPSPASSHGSTLNLETFNFSGRNTIIAVMLIIFLLMNLLLSPLQILMPTMAKDLFGNSFNSLAFLETVVGIGLLLGGALLTILSINRKPLFWTWCYLNLVGLSFLIFALSSVFGPSRFTFFGGSYQTSFAIAALSLLFLGFGLGVANILIINILQTQPRSQDVPKVMGYVNLISTASLPFSLALLGVLQKQVSVLMLGQAAGLLLVVFCIFSFLPFRRFGQEIFK